MAAVKLVARDSWIILDTPEKYPSGLDTRLREYIKPSSHRIFDHDSGKWQVYYKAFPMLLSVCNNYFDQVDYSDLPVLWTTNLKASFTSSQTPYTVLHLLPTAPPELVKASYRTLASLHHPDKGGDTAIMAKINEAYEDLCKKLNIK